MGHLLDINLCGRAQHIGGSGPGWYSRLSQLWRGSRLLLASFPDLLHRWAEDEKHFLTRLLFVMVFITAIETKLRQYQIPLTFVIEMSNATVNIKQCLFFKGHSNSLL